MKDNEKYYNTILLRYGEVGLKSPRKRPYFERIYVYSIQEAFQRNNIIYERLENAGGRFIVHTNQVKDALQVLQHIPGIQSMSPAEKIQFKNFDDLIQQVKEKTKTEIKGKTFRVTTRRTGKHTFGSMDVSKKLGEELLPFSKGVSLHDAEKIIYLEIRNEIAYIYTETIKGLDGMPASSSGKALCLFSGGIDSPVAAFQMIKRGIALDYIYVDISGDEQTWKYIAQLFNHISHQYSYNYKPKLYHVSAEELTKEIAKRVEPSFRQLALKIAFYTIAEQFIGKTYHAICTGESLAQKSSQTLPGLHYIQSFSTALVLRPLITMDKLEITKIAEKIGTFGMSQQVKEYCDLSEGKAVTATPLQRDKKQVEEFVEFMKEYKITNTTFKGEIDINTINEKEEKREEEKETIKKLLNTRGIHTIDIRLHAKTEQEPLGTDEQKYYYDLLTELDTLNNDTTYLFICENGVQSQSLVYACSQRRIKAFGLSKKEFLELKKQTR